MYCSFCGTDNPEDRQFCLACGTPLDEHNNEPVKEQEGKTEEVHLKIVREHEGKRKETKEQNIRTAEDQEIKRTEEQKNLRTEEQKQQDIAKIEHKKEHSIKRRGEQKDKESKNQDIKKSRDQEIKKTGKEEQGTSSEKKAEQHKIAREVKVPIVEESSTEDVQNFYKDLPVKKEESQKIKKSKDQENKEKAGADLVEDSEQVEGASAEKQEKTLEETNEQKNRNLEAGLAPAESSSESFVGAENKKQNLSQPTPKKEQNVKVELESPELEHKVSVEKKTEVVEKPLQKQDPLHKGVILGEDDFIGGDEKLSFFGIPQKKLKILIIIAAVWVVIVLLGAMFLASGSSENTPLNPVNQQTVLNEVSDLRGKLSSGSLELTWIPSTNEVKIVDQILEIYDMEGTLIKQINLGPDLFGYELSGLERGVQYRVVLKLKSDDGRLSGGKNTLITMPLNHDITRKQDLEELKLALENYYEAYGAYPKAKNYTSLLNSLIKSKSISRRILDPEYPEHKYEYKSIWDGESYELKIYFSDSEDSIFEGLTSNDHIYIYSPSNDKSVLDALRAEE